MELPRHLAKPRTGIRLRRKEHQVRHDMHSRPVRKQHALSVRCLTFDNHGAPGIEPDHGVGATLIGGMFKERCPSPELFHVGSGREHSCIENGVQQPHCSRVCASFADARLDSVLQRRFGAKRLIKVDKGQAGDLFSKDPEAVSGADLDPDSPLKAAKEERPVIGNMHQLMHTCSESGR